MDDSEELYAQATARRRLIAYALEDAAEEMVLAFNNDLDPGIPSLLPFDQLTVPQRMLVLSRLAETLADGYLGFRPLRAYGDAALVYVLDKAKRCVSCELDQVRDDQSAVDEPPTWRELICGAAREIGYGDDLPTDKAHLEEWCQVVDDIAELSEIDPIVYLSGPIFDAEPVYVYWCKLQYRPSPAMVPVFWDQLLESTKTMKGGAKG
jgi:hypothetical protein